MSETRSEYARQAAEARIEQAWCDQGHPPRPADEPCGPCRDQEAALWWTAPAYGLEHAS